MRGGRGGAGATVEAGGGDAAGVRWARSARGGFAGAVKAGDDDQVGIRK